MRSFPNDSSDWIFDRRVTKEQADLAATPHIAADIYYYVLSELLLLMQALLPEPVIRGWLRAPSAIVTLIRYLVALSLAWTKRVRTHTVCR
ncbi:hypothetical protein JOE66_002519 [Subtercola frigoramans]|uniref:Uncharacterized protein n=1 Tax=Subtercola frigoramans TaxID=120298 RepID=A0ABS2L711_9MICO|nr:hypothetical protein [Subtercola frigoramans]